MINPAIYKFTIYDFDCETKLEEYTKFFLDTMEYMLYRKQLTNNEIYGKIDVGLVFDKEAILDIEKLDIISKYITVRELAKLIQAINAESVVKY